MKLKTLLATVSVTALAALVAGLVPGLASADPASAVQADVTQLTSDVTAAHTALIADLSSVTTDATAGNKPAVRADVKKFRVDVASYLPPIRTDLSQLKSDLQAAHAANVTGLRALIKSSVVADRQTIKEIRQATGQARHAVQALRKP